ncbi:hypothetical protein FGO68_gene7856 [Halteria grandinella]|uniref:Uncharacterized protein n=1 Tax=Halteria grandinella TaxID=5974 RepID=A0A8J8P3D1_HALGN|nr:hypothetical protein FGO68_gene7856 [Halteria grandinella]
MIPTSKPSLISPLPSKTVYREHLDRRSITSHQANNALGELWDLWWRIQLFNNCARTKIALYDLCALIACLCFNRRYLWARHPPIKFRLSQM